SWRHVTSIAVVFAMLMMLAFIVLYNAIDPPALNAISAQQTSIMYYADGKGEMTRLGPTNREIVHLVDIPQHLQDAVIAAENRTFYSDRGISPKGIVRAFINNLTGGPTQGGSTITQQYAKQAFTNQERTLKRKVKEFFYAIKLDQVYTKDQILEDYLNQTYFGRGAYGVETAARVYFGKSSVKGLSVEQSAVLAALIRSPENLYNPDKHLDQLKDRWNYVLDSMVDTHTLSPERRAKAKFPAIKKWVASNRYAGTKGYIISAVEDELNAAGISDDEIKTGGLRIVTTINRDMQSAAYRAVTENWPKTGIKDTHIGMVSIDSSTGEVRAMIGGLNYLKYQYNGVTQAEVRPGSTFKVFGLAAVLADGYSLENRFDGNSGYDMEDGSAVVTNQGGTNYGSSVTLLEGTKKSINTVYANMADKLIGPRKIRKAAIDAGLPEDTKGFAEPNARIVLGIAAPRVIDMAAGYSTFANGGTRIAPHLVKEVRRADGSLVDLHHPEPVRRVFKSEVVNNVDYALQQVIQDGTGFRAQALGRPAAGKTGNHEGLTLWFSGFTPGQLTTTVAIWRGDGSDQEITVKDQYGNPHKVHKWDLGGYSNYKSGKDHGRVGFGDPSLRAGGGYPTLIWTAYMKEALDGMEIAQFDPFVPWGKIAPDFAPPTTQAPPTESTEPPTRTPTTPPPTGPPTTPTGPPTTPTGPPTTPTGPGTRLIPVW
ncbi:MAG TPA: transglycosylase domain-containing protein, partial [Actinomycetes bacterium]|nr:transglycosylase domain-containing protein [Actinomycetes bacterium]